MIDTLGSSAMARRKAATFFSDSFALRWGFMTESVKVRTNGVHRIRFVLPYAPSTNYLKTAIVIGSHARWITSRQARAYTSRVRSLLRAFSAPPEWDMTSRMAVTVDVYFPTRSGDLDNRHKLVLDLLQGVVYQNDSQIDRILVRRFISKDAPRVEVTVKTLAQSPPSGHTSSRRSPGACSRARPGSKSRSEP